MYKFLYLFLFVTLIGCATKEEDHQHSIPPEPDCTCPAEPTFYMVQIEYKDHQEKVRSFPHKVKWKGYYDHWKGTPDALYATKSVSIDGSFSWYYSLEEPVREENGLIRIVQVDGPVKKIDFKEIEVTLIPCQASDKLDELSKQRIHAAVVYVDHIKNKCPYHKDGGWHDEHW